MAATLKGNESVSKLKTEIMARDRKSKAEIKRIFDRYEKMRYFVVLEGVIVGAFGGGAAVLFRYILEKVSVIVPKVIALSGVSGIGSGAAGLAAESASAAAGGVHIGMIAAWFAVLLLAAAVTRLLVFAEPMIGGSGIPQVDGEMHGYFDLKWWRVLAAKIVGGLITLGCGLCLGREGPSVQIGAMAGKGFSRITGRMLTEERLLITCGASAGLAAAFNAPLAGAIFALEEIHKNYSLNVLLPALSASITSDFVCRRVFGLKPVFDFSGAGAIQSKYFWIVIIMAVAVGLLGAAYNAGIAVCQDLYDKVSRKRAGGYIRTAIPFVICGIVTFTFPIALGGGSGLVMDISEGLPLKLLAALLVVRFFYSIVSFSSGVPGGIFLPLLAMGAVCGGITHGIAGAAGIEISLAGLVAVAMVASFSAIVRSPVTGIVLLTEMTGNLDLLIFMALAALVAYATADLVHAEPVYEQLLHRMLVKQGQITKTEEDEKVIIEEPVEIGSAACGMKAGNLSLPAGCVLVTIKRDGGEIIPDAETELRPLDVICVLCMKNRIHRVQHMLDKRCRA